MFHRTVLGIPSENLDTYFTNADKTRQIMTAAAGEHEMLLIEGVMGLYDGVRGIEEAGSSYHLAEVTKTPIILVCDVHGMGRSMIPFIAGYLSYDKKKLIRGVILNRISGGFYDIMAPLIEGELGIEVLGYLNKDEKLNIGSRHLGLILPEEIAGLRDNLSAAARVYEESVDIDRICAIAKSASDIEICSEDKLLSSHDKFTDDSKQKSDQKSKQRPILAVARDEAFCFYYETNLRMLRERGVEIRCFSPIHDERLPEGISGILLGGGYPELYADALSKNKSMLASIRDSISEGMPSFAECGGFMYLHRSLTEDKGVRYELAGVIDEDVHYTGRSVRFGYAEFTDKTNIFIPDGDSIRGHEFHYYDSTGCGVDAHAKKPGSNRTWDCCYIGDNHWWGFPHLYYPSCEAYVDKMVEIMKG